MDWSKGFSASYYMAIIDKRTWNDASRREITGGSISRSGSGLRQSADIDCPGYEPGTEQWIRVWLDVRQNGAAEHVAVFTGLACSPSIKRDGNIKEIPLECYSVLKPADDVMLQRGWYIAAGMNGAQMAASMLQEVIPAPVIVEGSSPALRQAIIAEDGETVLSMVDKIIDAIGWQLRIDGMGTVTLREISDEPVATFGTDYDIVETEIQIEQDWFDCPNVFRAVSDDMTAIARDDSESSPLSTVTRGREIWMEETNCDMNDGESIEEYSIRRLKEEQQKSTRITYNRRFHPDVMTGDMIRMNYPAQELQGNYRVSDQMIQLEHGARTEEEVCA